MTAAGFSPRYLDYNATTPLDPRVFEAMLPWLKGQWGNPSSRHEYGRAARRALDTAREQVAAAVGAHPTEVVFTGGGSETNNIFLKGAMISLRAGAVAVSAIEHLCVLQPVRQFLRHGWRLHTIAVDGDGYVDEADFAIALQGNPQLISIMLANNETGAIQDIARFADLARQKSKAWVHSDAIQAFGKIPVDFRELNRAGVHALTLSSHKIHGPQGAAALIVDKRLDLAPLIAGGGQENGLRSGTENVAAIVGFGAACEQAAGRVSTLSPRLESLRDRFEAGLSAQGARIFAPTVGEGCSSRPRLPNTTFFALPPVDGETLVGRLDRAGFAVASGSACSSADPKPSHVLLAMGVVPEVARCAVRVSLGDQTQEADIDDLLVALQQITTDLCQQVAIHV